MAEEAGLCGGGSYYWWNNTTSCPCSTALGTFAWPTDRRTRSCSDEEEAIATAGCNNIALGDVQKPDSSDGLLQMMGFGLSEHWNQPNQLLGGGGEAGEANYNTMLLEDISPHQIQRDWTSPPKSFSSEEDDRSPSSFNGQINNTLLNTRAADNYSSSTLLQTLFDPDHHQQQQSLFNNRCLSSSMGTSLNSPSSWQNKLSPFLQQPKQQEPASSLHFSNNTPFWNGSAAPDLSFFTQSQFVAPTFEEKPNCSGLFASKTKMEQVRDSISVVKRGNSAGSTSDQQAFKRPRIETPSPLPTFKVRKEKLGDRITALQQLVSPFGKTDTASVLHEAIEYIKFLHDQVSVLSTPYMKNGATLQHQHQQASSSSSSDHHHHNVMKDMELAQGKQDLRSRGLCLVPISSTFPVANETTADFWTPTFGGTFR